MRLEMKAPSPPYADTVMTASSVNRHYHGVNTSPDGGRDDVLHRIVNSGQTYQYNVIFPWDEPPGPYWYHPHVHGLVEAPLQGGASGAIIVEGIQKFQPKVAGLEMAGGQSAVFQGASERISLVHRLINGRWASRL